VSKKKPQKKTVSVKKPSRKKDSSKMPCVCSLQFFDCDASSLTPRITRYLGILPGSGKIKITSATSLGIQINNPQSGAPVNNPVNASGVVVNGGNATVTAWLTDTSGNVTNGQVNYNNPPNWTANFPNVADGIYFLSAQAQLNNETACQTIQIIVVL
jgi:hypothetical protein